MNTANAHQDVLGETARSTGQGPRSALWSIGATIDLMRRASLLRDPEELVRLLGRHVGVSMPVDRAVVVTRKGLAHPCFRVVLALRWSQQAGQFEADSVSPQRQGGLLAELLYRGEVAIVDAGRRCATDPSADLLCGERSVLALPQFEAGEALQMIFLLTPEAGPEQLPELIELGGLALAANLIERIGEECRLASELDTARRALDRELAKAGEMQRMLLPAATAEIEGVGAAVSYITAAYSGGDYYCVTELADGRVLVLIADASGHGAPAAVIAAVIATAIQIQHGGWRRPAQVLTDLNRHLCSLRLVEAGGFVTACCGVLDRGSGMLAYASAGHPAPRIARSSGGGPLAMDGASALPLGIAADTVYTQRTAAMMPGDCVVLFTDGISEARAPGGEFFGERGIDEVLSRLPGGGRASSIIQAIGDAVAEFTHHADPADDQTIVAVTLEHATSAATPAGARGGPPDPAGRPA